jgi:L-lactate utilization protein LutC
MKHIVLMVLAVVVVSTCALALAQAPDAAVQTALLAAPANLREAATVIKWKADFTYDTLKQGTSRLVCYDRSGFPEQQAVSIECTSVANLDRVAQNLKFEAGGDKVKTQAMLDAAEKDGTRVKPEYGSVWYHMLGPDREHARIHVTIAVPGATTQSLGLPDNNKAGTVWIMNAGTSTAHLMTPGA